VSTLEELLKRILESQNRTETQLNNIQKEVLFIKSDVHDIKKSVYRIEEHQEESIMNMLVHIKKQGENIH
jgi:hypothetical protein